MEEVKVIKDGAEVAVQVHTEKILRKHQTEFLNAMDQIDATKKNDITGLADVSGLINKYIAEFTSITNPEDWPVDEINKVWKPIMRRLSPVAAMDFTAGSQKLQQ